MAKKQMIVSQSWGSYPVDYVMEGTGPREWYKGQQDAAVAYCWIKNNSGNVLRCQPGIARWASFSSRFLTAHTDVRTKLKTGTCRVIVRSQANGHFPSCYAVSFTAGAGTGSVDWIRMCTGTQTGRKTVSSLTFNSNDEFRIVCEAGGYVVKVYIAGVYIGEHDFAGDALCGGANWLSGGSGFQFLASPMDVEYIRWYSDQNEVIHQT